MSELHDGHVVWLRLVQQRARLILAYADDKRAGERGQYSIAASILRSLIDRVNKEHI